MPTSPPPIAASLRGLKTLSIAARILLWLVLAAWSLFAVSWAALQLWIVPGIGEWRPDLERWASRAVGVPVTVGAIVALPRAAGASGLSGYLPPFVPAFELRDVRLYDAQGRSALQLPLVPLAPQLPPLLYADRRHLGPADSALRPWPPPSHPPLLHVGPSRTCRGRVWSHA